MGVYATERSYPKVGVGQIWRQYLRQLKNYAHIWKLKHCANADADADADNWKILIFFLFVHETLLMSTHSIGFVEK